jgi:hypothetical protein
VGWQIFIVPFSAKKELLIKPGLSSSERKKINNILSKLKVLKVDHEISNKYML